MSTLDFAVLKSFHASCCGFVREATASSSRFSSDIHGGWSSRRDSQFVDQELVPMMYRPKSSSMTELRMRWCPQDTVFESRLDHFGAMASSSASVGITGHVLAYGGSMPFRDGAVPVPRR